MGVAVASVLALPERGDGNGPVRHERAGRRASEKQRPRLSWGPGQGWLGDCAELDRPPDDRVPERVRKPWRQAPPLDQGRDGQSRRARKVPEPVRCGKAGRRQGVPPSHQLREARRQRQPKRQARHPQGLPGRPALQGAQLGSRLPPDDVARPRRRRDPGQARARLLPWDRPRGAAKGARHRDGRPRRLHHQLLRRVDHAHRLREGLQHYHPHRRHRLLLGGRAGRRDQRHLQGAAHPPTHHTRRTRRTRP